jgi:hypothetical protein
MNGSENLKALFWFIHSNYHGNIIRFGRVISVVGNSFITLVFNATDIEQASSQEEAKTNGKFRLLPISDFHNGNVEIFLTNAEYLRALECLKKQY